MRSNSPSSKTPSSTGSPLPSVELKELKKETKEKTKDISKEEIRRLLLSTLKERFTTRKTEGSKNKTAWWAFKLCLSASEQKDDKDYYAPAYRYLDSQQSHVSRFYQYVLTNYHDSFKSVFEKDFGQGMMVALETYMGNDISASDRKDIQMNIHKAIREEKEDVKLDPVNLEVFLECEKKQIHERVGADDYIDESIRDVLFSGWNYSPANAEKLYVHYCEFKDYGRMILSRYLYTCKAKEMVEYGVIFRQRIIPKELCEVGDFLYSVKQTISRSKKEGRLIEKDPIEAIFRALEEQYCVQTTSDFSEIQKNRRKIHNIFERIKKSLISLMKDSDLSEHIIHLQLKAWEELAPTLTSKGMSQYVFFLPTPQKEKEAKKEEKKEEKKQNKTAEQKEKSSDIKLNNTKNQVKKG